MKEAVQKVEQRCMAKLVQLEQAEGKMKEMRAEVLREKLLREAEQRAAADAKKSAAKLKEKARQLGSYVRRVVAPSVAKVEVLQSVDNAMLGVADVDTGATSDADSDGSSYSNYSSHKDAKSDGGDTAQDFKETSRAIPERTGDEGNEGREEPLKGSSVTMESCPVPKEAPISYGKEL